MDQVLLEKATLLLRAGREFSIIRKEGLEKLLFPVNK